MAGAVRFELTARGFGDDARVFYTVFYCEFLYYLYKKNAYELAILTYKNYKLGIFRARLLDILLDVNSFCYNYMPYGNGAKKGRLVLTNLPIIIL